MRNKNPLERANQFKKKLSFALLAGSLALGMPSFLNHQQSYAQPGEKKAEEVPSFEDFPSRVQDELKKGNKVWFLHHYNGEGKHGYVILDHYCNIDRWRFSSIIYNDGRYESRDWTELEGKVNNEGNIKITKRSRSSGTIEDKMRVYPDRISIYQEYEEISIRENKWIRQSGDTLYLEYDVPDGYFRTRTRRDIAGNSHDSNQGIAALLQNGELTHQCSFFDEYTTELLLLYVGVIATIPIVIPVVGTLKEKLEKRKKTTTRADHQ